MKSPFNKLDTPEEDMVDRVGQFGVNGSRGTVPSDSADRWVDLRSFRPSFGALLMRAGVASDTQLGQALDEGAQTGERLGEVVIRKGWASEEQVARLLSEQWQLEFREAGDVSVNAEALQRVSLVVARELGALPIGFDGTTVVLAVADPSEELFAEAQSRIGDVSFVVVARSVLDPLLNSASVLEVQEPTAGEEAPMYEDERVEHEEVAPHDDYLAEPLSAEPPESAEPVEAPADEPSESVEPSETTSPEPSTLEPKRVAIEGSGDDEVATVIESIDLATAGLGRVRTEVDQLGQSLRSTQDRLADRESELVAAAETHEQDTATIRRLEDELAHRADLFAKLTAQISTLTDTVREGAVENGSPPPYAYS